jgi:2-polyprenyl-6-methoxyphenol hydroxylase-like FAD-dependent oxidoreductase
MGHDGVVKVVVIGAGVAGLGCALALSGDDHDVLLIERDDTPLPDDADGAFEWDRKGAPQVRHSHALLARLRNLLRDRHPDVLADLLAAGATEMDFIGMLPDDMDHTRLPGDEDLVALACRRTTFEWILRRHVLKLDHVDLMHGHVVEALTGSGDPAAPPVTGVTLDDGTTIEADLVVAAGGRRLDVPKLLAPLGVAIEEKIEDTGIIYFSRFYKLIDGADWPEQVGPIGGDLGYLKYGVFQGDNRTFSITLAIRTSDDELRAKLLDPDQFQQAAAHLAATGPYVDGRSEPITPVNVMARLLNRHRTFTDTDGAPLAPGFVAVGDAHTCTNPLYGRGCSLGVVQAELLLDSIRSQGPDLTAIGREYERQCDVEIEPWYRAAVMQDAANRADGEEAAEPTDSAESAGEELSMRAVMRDGLFPAMREHPTVLRAFLRMFNLLESPDSLMTNGEVITLVMQAYATRDERPPVEPLGPGRDGMLNALVS